MEDMVRSTLDIEITEEGKKHWLVSLDGVLDVATSGKLEEYLRGIDETAKLITVDLTNVSFMDSSGLRALLAPMGTHKGKLVVHGMSAAVARVLEITGLMETLQAK